ncbi:OsmC family protein [Flavobacterium beibuense]|uniref:Putative redox protein, regulator of disulfide bond formation n=1 Tax=Flavobacterium beibuense TaxID=657326 RepID=A0A444WEI4_9FLAO|nr:OsmC family protein [Flavobacterium beibuense]RYJ44219.1 putative redox protein, regulator of disulfide bond formation [Flavobacterium beibuense]
MATTISVRNLPIGFQSIISNGSHGILGDEPLETNGTGLGFSPRELLLGAIGMCKAATVRFIANKRGWPIGDVEVELTMDAVRTDDGGFTTHVKTGIHIQGELTQKQKEDLFRHADKCFVVRLIEGDWEFDPPHETKKEELPAL